MDYEYQDQQTANELYHEQQKARRKHPIGKGKGLIDCVDRMHQIDLDIKKLTEERLAMSLHAREWVVFTCAAPAIIATSHQFNDSCFRVEPEGQKEINIERLDFLK